MARRLSEGEPCTVVHVVVTDAFAGAERYVVRVAAELAARGHRVHTVGGDQVRMRDELPESVSVRPAATLLGAARALVAVGDVDLVHVHMTAAEGSAWLARPFRRAPVVATRHFARRRGSSRVARALASVTSRTIACDIAISRFVADAVDGSPVLITNGVPHQPQAPLESPTVVMLQRLEPEKSPLLGLEAYARSGLAGQGWGLAVAGDGQLRGEMERSAQQWGVAGRTVFAGEVSDTDHLLRDASVLLAPGHLDGFGLSVVEAMAHGVPVVAARAGGHLETLGGDGLLFRPGDVEGAATALVRLADDPALRHSVGVALRRRQQLRFSLPRHVDRLESLYRAVLGSTAARDARFDPAAFPAEGTEPPASGEPALSDRSAPAVGA